MSCLEGRARPDMLMAMHQGANFPTKLITIQVTAVKRISKYLIGTTGKGLEFKPHE